MLNAPAIFGTVWGLLSKWIDPRTAAKLVIVPSADTLQTLSSTIAVENIPTQFGGGFDFHHGAASRLDRGLLDSISWVQMPTDCLPPGPLKWLEDDGEDETLLGVGALDGENHEILLGKHRAGIR